MGEERGFCGARGGLRAAEGRGASEGVYKGCHKGVFRTCCALVSVFFKMFLLRPFFKHYHHDQFARSSTELKARAS